MEPILDQGRVNRRSILREISQSKDRREMFLAFDAPTLTRFQKHTAYLCANMCCVFYRLAQRYKSWPTLYTHTHNIVRLCVFFRVVVGCLLSLRCDVLMLCDPVFFIAIALFHKSVHRLTKRRHTLSFARRE